MEHNLQRFVKTMVRNGVSEAHVPLEVFYEFCGSVPRRDMSEPWLSFCGGAIVIRPLSLGEPPRTFLTAEEILDFMEKSAAVI